MEKERGWGRREGNKCYNEDVTRLAASIAKQTMAEPSWLSKKAYDSFIHVTSVITVISR